MAFGRLFLIGTLVLLVGACSPDRAARGSKPPQPGGPSQPRGQGSPAAPRPTFTGPTFTLRTEGLPDFGSWKCDPTLGDVNGDGRVDLAVLARLGNGPQVFLQQADGSWEESSQGLTTAEASCGGGICLADVNNDGRRDLVVADHCHGLSVYLNDGAGGWNRAVQDMVMPDPGQPYPVVVGGTECVAVGDIDEDGFLDIVVGSSNNGGLHVLKGDGSGQTWIPLPNDGLPDTRLVYRARLADLNGDGHLDLAATFFGGPQVWLGDGHGGWRPASSGLPQPMLEGIYHGLAIGDVNEDGRPDLLFANWIDGPEVYLQQPDGSWRKTVDVFPEMLGGAESVGLGDINQDRHLDMVISGRLARENGRIYGVFFLKGDGQSHWTWAKGSLVETGLASPWGVTLYDINNDGVLDVVVGSGGIYAKDPARDTVSIASQILVWTTSLAQRTGTE